MLCISAFSDDRHGHRDDRRDDRYLDSGPGHGSGLDPTDDRVQNGRDPLPSNQQKIAVRHDEVQPSVHPRMAAGSNTLHAIGSALRPDTNSRLSKKNRALDCEA